MNLHVQTFIVSLVVLLQQQHQTYYVVHGRRDSHMYQVDENLMLVRCQKRYCTNNQSSMDDCSLQKCLERSLNSNKEGFCPSSEQPASNSLEPTLCQDTCRGRDFSCPGTQKCCSHRCGRACQPANGLYWVADSVLPAIPQDVKVTNTSVYRNTAEIAWHQTYSTTSNFNVTFVTEAQSHPGYHFNPYKLGKWFIMRYELTSVEELKQQQQSIYGRGRGGGVKVFEYNALVRLRPGRWYIFRVAAVNENGTRGYSNSSQRFQLKERPKNPLAPRKFTLEKQPKLIANNTVYAKVSWKPQRSDYPTERYRITWSLHIQSDNTSHNQSLWLNDAYVLEPTRYFEFWDLKPNAYYYVQLQALYKFGRRTLKSPIETLCMNTSLALSTYRPVNSGDEPRQPSSSARAIDLVVRNLSNHMCGLIVRILWPDTVENVSWLELCSGGAECHHTDVLSSSSHHYKSKVRPKNKHFDFANLMFNQRYSVRLVTQPRREGDSVKTFTTPTAEQFRRKHSNCFKYHNIA